MHRESEVTTWEDPRQGGNGEEMGGAAGAASAAAAPTSPESKANVLPPGWEERTDVDGRTYFINHTAKVGWSSLPP